MTLGAHVVLRFGRSIDCVCVFALTAPDAAHVLAVIEGADARDPYCDFKVGVAALPPKLRVAIPAEPVSSGDAGYEAAFAQAVAHLRSLGHSVEEINFAPLYSIAELLYGGPWVAARHAVVQTLLEREPQALDRTVRSVVEMARDYTATERSACQDRVREARRDIAALWQDVDLLMVPTAGPTELLVQRRHRCHGVRLTCGLLQATCCLHHVMTEDDAHIGALIGLQHGNGTLPYR